MDPEAATADVVPAGAAADAPDERSTTRPASGRRRAIAVGLALFGASLLLRLVVLSAVGQQRLAPLFDERGYYEQAVGFGEVFSHLLHGEAPPPQAWNAAYRHGVWPPGYPMIVGLVFAFVGPGLAAARAVVAVVSALTTLVVFLVSRRWVEERAAIAAAAAHLLYPSFVAFSHLLWSESFFIAVALLAVWAAAALRAAPRSRSRLLAAALLGLCAGYAVLIRVAGLLWPLLAPLWPLGVLRGKPGRWAATALVALVGLAVLAPWEVTIARLEGHPVLLSTAGGYNMLLGAVPNAVKGELRREIGARAHAAHLHPDAAARQLARQRVQGDPLGFARQVLARAAAVWRPDEIVLRHLLQAVYPPLGQRLTLTLVAVIALAEGAFLSLLAFGVATGWRRIGRAPSLLLMAAAAAVLLPALLTVGNTRMVLPVLALALPFVGVGIAELRHVRRHLPATAAALVVLAAFLIEAHWGGGGRQEVSSWYREAAPRIDRWLGTETVYHDTLQVRVAGESRVAAGTLSLGDGYVFAATGAATAPVPQGRRSGQLEIRAEHPNRPLELRPMGAGSEAAAPLAVTEPRWWMRWRPSGLPGVSVRWMGARGNLPQAQSAAEDGD